MSRVTDPGSALDAVADINLDARLGLVAGTSKDSALGHSDDVGTTLGLLYHGHVTAAPIEPNISAHLETPAVVKVASTSANDKGTATAGTGARTVLLVGLDENLEVATETVTLDGQTAVTTTTTFAVVRKMQVTSAGTGGVNDGTIWVGTGSFTTGVPATHLNAMEAGTNISATALMAVPASFKWVVDQFSIYSGDTSKVLNFQFYQYSYATGLWYEAFDIHGKQDAINPDVYSYPPLTAGDLLALRTAVNTGTAKVTGSISGFLAAV